MLHSVSPLSLALIRFLLAFPILLGIVLYLRREHGRLTRREYALCAGAGFFGVAAYHLFYNYGQMHVNAGTASIIIASNPVFILILAAAFLGERITWLRSVGVLLSFAGNAAIVVADPGFAPEVGFGLAAASIVAAAAAAAAYTVLGKSLMGSHRPLYITGLVLVFGSMELFVLLPFSDYPAWVNISRDVWVIMVLLAVFPTVLGYAFWYESLARTEASHIAVYIYLIPVVALTGGVVLLGESLSLLSLIGMGLVFAGISLVEHTASAH